MYMDRMEIIHNFRNKIRRNELKVSNHHYIFMGGDFNIVVDKNVDTLNVQNVNNSTARSEIFLSGIIKPK